MGVRGIVASMSGLTTGAVEHAADHAGQRVILLFSPGDVRALTHQESSFEELLNEKSKALVTRRQIPRR